MPSVRGYMKKIREPIQSLSTVSREQPSTMGSEHGLWGTSPFTTGPSRHNTLVMNAHSSSWEQTDSVPKFLETLPAPIFKAEGMTLRAAPITACGRGSGYLVRCVQWALRYRSCYRAPVGNENTGKTV